MMVALGRLGPDAPATAQIEVAVRATSSLMQSRTSSRLTACILAQHLDSGRCSSSLICGEGVPLLMGGGLHRRSSLGGTSPAAHRARCLDGHHDVTSAKLVGSSVEWGGDR